MTKAGLVLTSFVVCAFAPWPSQAEEASSLSIGVRARVGGERVLGEEQPEAFREYDVGGKYSFALGALLRVRLGCRNETVSKRRSSSRREEHVRSSSLLFLFLPSVVKTAALCSTWEQEAHC